MSFCSFPTTVLVNGAACDRQVDNEVDRQGSVMGELRKGFHNDLDEARAALVRLAASVTEAIPRATAVLLDGDLEGADYIIQGDDEIDARSLDLEEHCYRILALQAPVASDLRQAVARRRA